MIRDFFYPKSIAIIGATANPKKFGNAVTINILKNKDLISELYLVTKNAKEISGRRCYRSILDVSEQIDIAIILVPSKAVEAVIQECIEKKVKGIIIVTAGFGEINDEGKIIENRIAMKCKNAGIRVIGPNCVGIQNNEINLNASFIQAAPKGNISMISQSGSFACASFYAMEQESLGCSKFANIGNNIDVSFVDILEYYNDDDKSKIISIYMETMSDGKDFYNTIKKINTVKPIIILKGGKSEYGMKAASSHTGAIATNYKLLKAAIKQAGAILCEETTDFIVALKTYSFLPLPKGEKIGVLTNSGGSSVLFSDKAEEYGLKLVEFSNELIQKVKPYLIPLVKFVNPLDMIGVAEEKQYYEITKAMLEDPDIDIVVPCLVVPPFLEMTPSEHYRGMIRAWNDTHRKKPLIPLIFMGKKFNEIKELAIQEKAPIYYNPQEAAYAIKLLVERKKTLKRLFN
ncbi:MAG: acetyl-CoA synthetase [Promethearchaeota archaeon]|nr:MAG: acetyl-CoA synthetase [Candidatus Lokiarchaeota archaeon]